MLRTKLKIATAVFLLVGVLAFSSGRQFLALRAEAAAQNKPAPAAEPEKAKETPRVEIRFVRPAAMKISWLTADQKFTSQFLEVPGRYSFLHSAVYRLKLADIPNRPGLELFPTLEITPVTKATEAFVNHNAVPVEFTDADFDKVSAGQTIVKVVYLPSEAEKDKAPAVLVSYDDPKKEVIEEAQRRGTILAVVRMGNIDFLNGLDAKDGTRTDKDQLQGTWLLVGLETDGLRLGAGRPELKELKAVIDGDHLTLVDKDGKKTFRMKLDPDKKPKEMMLTLREIAKAYLGVYEVAGDSFKLCFTKDGDPRPTDFTAEVGSKRWSYTFKRDKPERADAPVGAKGDLAWDRLGLKLEPVGAAAVIGASSELHGGLKVAGVRATIMGLDGKPQVSPAAKAKIEEGDILLGLHQWETLSSEDVVYTLGYCQGARMQSVRCYLLRDKQIMRSELAVPTAAKGKATIPME